MHFPFKNWNNCKIHVYIVAQKNIQSFKIFTIKKYVTVLTNNSINNNPISKQISIKIITIILNKSKKKKKKEINSYIN